MNKNVASLAGGFALCMGLSAFATAGTITLNFEDCRHQDEISTRYQSLGVTASGAFALAQFSNPWPAHTPTMAALASTGEIIFTLDSSITGPIKGVSLYASVIQTAQVGVYAYDADGILVGQAVSQPGAENELLTVVSTGNPIVSVSVHDSGSNFAIDTVTFSTDPAIPFSNFAPTLAVTLGSRPNSDSFSLSSPLTFSAGASAFNPVSDIVIFKIGTLAVTIPANSFKSSGNNGFAFRAKMSNGTFSANIQSLGSSKYTVAIGGSNVSLAGISNPVPVSLAIGSNAGDRDVAATIKTLPRK